ncbi:MAG: protein kinase [Gemmatimonadetes bacterium]|nr:protein kinase [Gemmatimonadota bacterium]
MRALTESGAPDALFVRFQQAVAGRYSLDRELGRGGNGIVYLAREVHLDRLVAIKLLPPERAESAETREHFLREARVAAGLSHPHIVPIHAVDHVSAFVFFVMAFIDGETLAQRVQARGPVAGRDATRWLREVAWALSYAHGRGVIHRDIKPDNILVERESGRAFVADFGIAHEERDDTAALVGTPEFMAPELALGGTPAVATDLYALGITAWYLLTGRVPFTAHDATQVLAQHCTAALPPLATHGVPVPRRLADLVRQCLAKDPAQRPPTADAVAARLDEALEQRRELPVPLRAFVRRHGRMDGGGTVLALLGALGGGVGVAAWLGPVAGVLTLVGTVAAAPIVFGVVAARRLMRHGYAQADLDAAFAAELDVVREDAGVDTNRASRWLERGARALARIAARTTAALVPFALASAVVPRFAPVTTLLTLAGATTGVLTIAWLAVMPGRRDVDVRFWRQAWTGRFGRAVFGVARRVGAAAPATPIVTHRATELSLSLAAEQLFDALPRSTRTALGDLPDVVHRLQQQAGALRTRVAQLQELCDRDAASAQDRDTAQRRLQDTVVALETLRLGLLRLHAGTATVDSVTRELGAATDLAAEVSRLAEAHAEVHRLLATDAAFARQVGHDVALSPA